MPIQRVDARWLVMWKDEDENEDGVAIGPVWVFKNNKAQNASPNWGTKAEAETVARILNCEMEEQ